MLFRSLMFVAVAVVVAVQVPPLLQMVTEASKPAPLTAEMPMTVAAAPQPSNAVVLKADGKGHFSGDFRINGKVIPGLIDTGASMIALNESTARRLGFGGNALDFRYNVDTANGKTDAAHVRLDRVEIGSIRVSDVDAFVLRDSALSSTLIGMSFLKKLGSYSVDGDRMSLTR